MEQLEGILKIANLFLAIVAGFIALGLFRASRKKEILRAWKVLIFALVLFSIQEILGALRAFSIYESPFLTHIIPTVILGLLITALVFQINLGEK